MGIEVGGILGLFILIADIWAIVKTFESPTSTGNLTGNLMGVGPR